MQGLGRLCWLTCTVCFLYPDADHVCFAESSFEDSRNLKYHHHSSHGKRHGGDLSPFLQLVAWVLPLQLVPDWLQPAESGLTSTIKHQYCQIQPLPSSERTLSS